jgi:hypothetical protein
MGDSNERLREARRDAGFRSAPAAAKRFGWVISTYASHENGQTPVPAKAAEDYAKAFKVSAAWIMYGEGSRRRRTTPVTLSVAPGAELVDLPESASETDLPADLPAGATPVIVRDESLYPRYYSGEGFFYLDRQRTPDDLIGKECVVQLKNGKRLVGILRRGSRRRVFNIERWQFPLLEDQEISWAARTRRWPETTSRS